MSEELQSNNPDPKIGVAQNQPATEGVFTVSRRRWQEGSVYLRKSKTLPDAWWGRYVETVETETGTVRVQRNVRLGDVRTYTKPLAKRALREYVDRANCYQPQAVKTQTMGKLAVPFSVFAARWQQEVMSNFKLSTLTGMNGHINNFLIPAFGKLAMGDVDSERVQLFLNRLPVTLSAKTRKNIWGTLRLMWVSAVAWKYAADKLCVARSKKARKLRMRCYSVQEAKRILANTQGADQAFFWLALETGARVGELIALRVSDVNLSNLSADINKAIWRGQEDSTKTEAGFRTISISALLGAAIKEYLAGRSEGYLFQTPAGDPWEPGSIKKQKLNKLLRHLNIPRVDLVTLAKILGKDRTIADATRSEKHACALGLHSFRHTNVTAMDSLGLPEQIRKQRVGHSGGNVHENYAHTFTENEREAAEKLGQFFGTNWPTKDEGNLISFPSLSQTDTELSATRQQVVANQ